MGRKVNIVVLWLYYRPQESQNRRIEALLVHLHTNYYGTVNSEFTEPPLFNNPPHLLPIGTARLTGQGEVHLQRRPDKSSRKLPVSQLLSLLVGLTPRATHETVSFEKLESGGPCMIYCAPILSSPGHLYSLHNFIYEKPVSSHVGGPRAENDQVRCQKRTHTPQHVMQHAYSPPAQLPQLPKC